MTKVGTLYEEMDKVGTFCEKRRLLKRGPSVIGPHIECAWALCDWSIYRARVLRAHARDLIGRGDSEPEEPKGPPGRSSDHVGP